jgi:hypothetical protein
MEGLPSSVLSFLLEWVLVAEHAAEPNPARRAKRVCRDEGITVSLQPVRRLLALKVVSKEWKRAVERGECGQLWRSAVYWSLGEAPQQLFYGGTYLDVVRCALELRKALAAAKTETESLDYPTACEAESPPLFVRPYVAPSGEYKAILSEQERKALCVVAKELLLLLQRGLGLGGEEWARIALQRYKMWILLRRRHPAKVLVPTLDIELVWVGHILRTRAYYADCARLAVSPEHSLVLPSAAQPLYSAAVKATARA